MTLGCAAVLALGACSSSGTPSSGGTLSGQTPQPTATVTVTATATATVKTTVTATPKPATTPAHTSFTTPEAAAKNLYNAWKNDDKPTALKGASKYAVDSLFVAAWVDGSYFFGGCTASSGPSECDYNASAGVYKMMIIPASGGGYLVDEVLLGNAG